MINLLGSLAVEPELLLRLIFFGGILSLMLLWEWRVPLRRNIIPRRVRWLNNFGLMVLNAALLRLTMPAILVATAALAAREGWGLLNMVTLPWFISCLLALILLDLSIYVQHVLFHMVPSLWRIHRVHHTDVHCDVTTSLRFHPFEMLLSNAIKLTIVLMIGAPIVAVISFEVLLNGTSMFNHANVNVSNRFDTVLRWLVVTPNMHRIHHSVSSQEYGCNFGFNLPWWDKLFGTYLVNPALGHLDMEVGTKQFRTRRDLWLDKLLIQPFLSERDNNNQGRGSSGRF